MIVKVCCLYLDLKFIVILTIFLQFLRGLVAGIITRLILYINGTLRSKYFGLGEFGSIVFHVTYKTFDLCLLFVWWSCFKKPSWIKLCILASNELYKLTIDMIYIKDYITFIGAQPTAAIVSYIFQILLEEVIQIMVYGILVKMAIHHYRGDWVPHFMLTVKEVTEFFKGTRDKSDNFIKQPYNDSYELCENKLTINKDWEPIGKGQHGVVYRGIYRMKKQNIVVAAKICDNKNQDKKQFLLMLNEIKLMSNIGNHDNVLTLFKACTKHIGKGELKILTLLCPLGSLEKYLKDADVLVSVPPNNNAEGISISVQSESVTFNSGNTTQRYQNVQNYVTLEDLQNFSVQTAEGMGFLSSNKIIHGDLASRNVLLSMNKIIKIADFGLSHHLYNYKLYIKQNSETELPWRWMPPESIKDLVFSTKSDVWSYGVFLWEIYSGGMRPYEGTALCDFDFICHLEAGFRLPKPQYCHEEMYQLMTECWHIETVERPTFAQIIEILKPNTM